VSTLPNTPSALIGVDASRAEESRNASSARTSSARTAWVNTYTTASAAATSEAESASMPASNGAVDVPTAPAARSLTTVSVDARPGVSTTVRSRSFSLVRVTSTYATRAAGTPRRCGIMPSSSSGRLWRCPSRQTTSTRSAVP
jgi:hypothetical protein